MLYSLARRFLFRIDPEKSHHLALKGLRLMHQLHLTALLPKPVVAPVEVMGLKFPNAVGLAAGLDKNADYLDALGAMGFGFVEVGTVTPRPQPGNPIPRLFRLPEAEAIINRMGFNNLGVEHLVKQVKQSKYSGIIGINIGKNFDTPVERAAEDYLIGLNAAYPHADYITVNISSPNTPGLRTLQFGESLDNLLVPLKKRQQQLADETGRYVPLVVKIAPDMDDAEIELVAQSILKNGLDGVIATNTTLARDEVSHLPHGNEAGGLSGRPVMEKSTHVVKQLVKALDNQIPVIAAGGIMSAEDAQKKLEAGAQLVQIYTGFIYHGPALVQACANAIKQKSQ